MFKNVIFLLLIICAAVIVPSCKTAVEESYSDTEDPTRSLYPSRPKLLLESYQQSLPLSLHWESVEGAQTYEIEMADSPLFNSSLRNWTIRDNSFQVDALVQTVMYLRIRSRFDTGTSRWSETLELKEEDDKILLGWVR